MILEILLTAALTAVNPYIGSGGHGHVFVGADVPHGAVHCGPMNTTLGWDWCSGYHAGDSTLAGYAQTRLGGTGVADFGDFVILPQTSADTSAREFIRSITVEPGYCEVLQSPSGIRARMTASEHTARYEFTFPEGVDAYLKVDNSRGAKSLLFRRGLLEGSIALSESGELLLYRKTNFWATGRQIWGIVKFDTPLTEFDTDAQTYALIGFGTARKVCATVAVSLKDPSSLESNLGEAASFRAMKRRAARAWKQELGRISFKGIAPVVDTVFNTALYHTMTSPQLYSDAGEAPSYTIFSLWDTYRATHPLYNLVDPRAGTYVNNLLDIYDQTGRLPVWHLSGVETDCMVGVHSITVMADAALKGIPGVDPLRVLEACKDMLSQPTYGMALWDTYGYLPADLVNYSVSVELEYCINAKAVADLAAALGDSAAASSFAQRSLRYQRHFDPVTGFMRPVLSDGTFREPFDPSFSLHDEADYVEGNAWQYTFLVPQDVAGLAALYGGTSGLLSKLDGLFSASSALNEEASADITGMIGQYAHGNEPSHHIAYMYAMLGEPSRTADLVRQICTSFYKKDPDGLIGNEDCGQMSAWYVFSALGFYPVEPTGGRYVFGSPLCKRATLRLANGRKLRIRTHGNSLSDKYIRKVLLNGKPLDTPYITHQQLMSGGRLEFYMTAAYDGLQPGKPLEGEVAM